MKRPPAGAAKTTVGAFILQALPLLCFI